MERITKKDIKYIERAKQLSIQSPMEMKHGCIITNHQCIVGEGYNNYRNQFHDGFIGISCSCHAEMMSLRQMIKKNKKRKRKVSRPTRKT